MRDCPCGVPFVLVLLEDRESKVHGTFRANVFKARNLYDFITKVPCTFDYSTRY